MKNKFCYMLLMFCVVLFLTGCNQGGSGGPLSFLSSGSSGDVTDGGGVIGGGEDAIDDDVIPPVHHPEPSSMLLFGSGLLGMAVYAKTRLKYKSKK